jgi:hypothetical protein
MISIMTGLFYYYWWKMWEPINPWNKERCMQEGQGQRAWQVD